MRNRSLHDALRDFALEAAALLSADLEDGAELPFEVEEAGGRRAVLYNYRPLTDRFIRERWPRLRALPAFGSAAAALGSGAAAYLTVQGVPGDDSEPALQAMLERIYEDATDFGFPEERFERVYAEVERTLYEHAMRLAVVTPLRGVRIESDRVELGGGIHLQRGDWSDAPPEAVWPRRAVQGDTLEPNVICVWERDVESAGALPLADAATAFAAVQSGLRLFKAGGVAIGPLAWARADGGPWQSFAVGSPEAPRDEGWLLESGEEEELREFLAMVGGSPHAGAVAWALARFELGCERPDEGQALSDYLLGLGALLDGADEAGRASLSLRIAALCADEARRGEVRSRTELALTAERNAMRARRLPPAGLAAEMEHHLRALLRDVLCGYLEPDLTALADGILLADGHARRGDVIAVPPDGGKIVVRRLDGTPGAVPTERDERAPAEDGELEPETAEFASVDPDTDELEPAHQVTARRKPRSQLAWSPPAGAPPQERPAPPEERAEPVAEVEEVMPVAEVEEVMPVAEVEEVELMKELDDAGVTPSLDWDYDDPDSFSAPI